MGDRKGREGSVLQFTCNNPGVGWGEGEEERKRKGTKDKMCLRFFPGNSYHPIFPSGEEAITGNSTTIIKRPNNCIILNKTIYSSMKTLQREGTGAF